jgi:hypothetical protein
MMRNLAAAAAIAVVAGCATLEPDPSDVARYCTPDHAFQLGGRGKPYYGTCPKDREPEFLAAYERGKQYRPTPSYVLGYYEQMDEAERQLLSASSEADRLRLRQQLADLDWKIDHILKSPGTYAPAGGGTP